MGILRVSRSIWLKTKQASILALGSGNCTSSSGKITVNKASKEHMEILTCYPLPCQTNSPVHTRYCAAEERPKRGV
eukprot:scaffold92099_cov11-Tisochrysis_lutea.AAC.1